MLGVIWLVQIVQYPSFALLSEDQFKNYHKQHSDRISWIVAPVMLLELITAYWLFYEIGGINTYYFVITVLIFAATAFVSVPLHNKLSLSKDDRVLSLLIKTNWIRTLLWTTKTLILFSYQ